MPLLTFLEIIINLFLSNIPQRITIMVSPTSTVADTCHILFFSGISTHLEYKAVEILAARLEYYKRVWNIINVFCNTHISNTFGTLATRFE